MAAADLRAVNVERKLAVFGLITEGEGYDVCLLTVDKAEAYGVALIYKRLYLFKIRYRTVCFSHQNRYTLISYGLVVKPLDITKLLS